MFANNIKESGAQCNCCPECSCWIRRRESRAIEGSYLEPKQMVQKAIEGSFLERKENTAERHDFEIPCLRCRCKQGIAVLCDHCQAHMAIKKKLNNFTSESRQITQAWTEPKTVHPKLVTRVTTDVSKVFILPQSKTKIDRYSPKEKNFALEPSEKSIPCDNLERSVSSKEKSHGLIQQKPTLLHPGEPEKTVEFPSDDSIITSFLTSFPTLDKKKDFEFVFPKGKKFKQFNLPVSSSELIADVLKKKREEMYERKDEIKAKDDEVYFSETQARRERGDYSATTDDKRERDYPPETQPKEERGILPAIHAKEDRGHPPYLESRVPSRGETKQSRGERKLPPATHTREESSHPSEKESQLQGPKGKLVKQDEKDIKDKKQTPEKQAKEQKGLPFQPADKSNRKLSIPPPARLPRPLATKEKEPSQKTTRKDGEIIKESNVKERIDQPQDTKRKVKQEEKSTNVKKQPFEKQVKEDKGITSQPFTKDEVVKKTKKEEEKSPPQQTERKVKQEDISTKDKKIQTQQTEGKVKQEEIGTKDKKSHPQQTERKVKQEEISTKDKKIQTQQTEGKVKEEEIGTKDKKSQPQQTERKVKQEEISTKDKKIQTQQTEGKVKQEEIGTKDKKSHPQQTEGKVKQEEIGTKDKKSQTQQTEGKVKQEEIGTKDKKSQTRQTEEKVKQEEISTKDKKSQTQQTEGKEKQEEIGTKDRKSQTQQTEGKVKQEEIRTKDKKSHPQQTVRKVKQEEISTKDKKIQTQQTERKVKQEEIGTKDKKSQTQQTEGKVKQEEIGTKDKKQPPEKQVKEEKEVSAQPFAKSEIPTKEGKAEPSGKSASVAEIKKSEEKPQVTKEKDKKKTPEKITKQEKAQPSEKPEKKLPPPPPPKNDIFTETITVQNDGPYKSVVVAEVQKSEKKPQETKEKVKQEEKDQKKTPEKITKQEKAQPSGKPEKKLPPPPLQKNDIFTGKISVQKDEPPDVKVAISKDQGKKQITKKMSEEKVKETNKKPSKKSTDENSEKDRKVAKSKTGDKSEKESKKVEKEKVAQIEIIRSDVVLYDTKVPPPKPEKEIKKSQLEPLPQLVLKFPTELELDLKTLQNIFKKKELPTDNEFIKNDKIVENLPEHHEILEIQEPSTMIQMTHNFSEIDFVDEESEEEGQADPPTGIHYALSDRSYIENGWTQLPVERVVRKMFVYRSRCAQPEFDWFKNNQKKGTMFYESGEKLAEIDDTGYGRWYYKNGRTALDFHKSEDAVEQKRVVVYSSGERDENGKQFPVSLLAMFDFIGNGIVFDHNGRIRLNYNQTEGKVHDQKIGPTSHWKWHSLNDPPLLQRVMMNTFSTEKDPNILKLSNLPDSDPEVQKNFDMDMIAIEFDNFVKKVADKQSQKFSPFQIRMKALKINDQFSLRILDQTRIYLYFRDGSTKMKMNLGLLLDSEEVVDTDTAEIGIIKNSILHPNPPKTKSMLVLNQNYMEAKKINGKRNWHDNQVRNPMPVSSVDRMLSAKSGAARPIPYVYPHMVIPNLSCASEIVPDATHACIEILPPDTQICSI